MRRVILVWVLGLLLLPLHSEARERTSFSIRFMTRMNAPYPPIRCSATRIGRRSLATAAHCVWGALAPYIAAPLVINTELVGNWITVYAKVNPDFPPYFEKKFLAFDTALLTLEEGDEKYLADTPIFAPCKKGPQKGDKLQGSSQWFGSLFNVALEETKPEISKSHLPVKAEVNQRFLGFIEEESGSGLFKAEDGKMCWLAALSSKLPSPDFIEFGNYSGLSAFEWIKPLVK